MAVQMGTSLMSSDKHLRMSGTKFFDFLEAINRKMGSAEAAVKDVHCLEPFNPGLSAAAHEVRRVCIVLKVQVVGPKGQSTSLVVQLVANILELIYFAFSLVEDAAPISVDVAGEEAALLTPVDNTVWVGEEVVIYQVAQLSR
jgi:hypothetical protein